MPIIYLDVLFAVNWLLDYLLLAATTRILRLTPKRWRQVLSAFIGAAIACGLFLLTAPTAVLVVLHLLSAAILVLTAYSFSGITAFLKRTVVLYVVAALFSGLTTALWSVTGNEALYVGNGIVYVDVSPLLLAILAALSYVMICLYERITRKRVPMGYAFRLCIDDGEGVCECRALYDTGMQLTEPFSGRPVVIVEWATLAPYLSAELTEALCYATAGDSVQACRRIRMVPYRALGSDGLLSAFVPKRMTIAAYGGSERDISGTYVAVKQGLDRGEYQALVGSDTVGKG